MKAMPNTSLNFAAIILLLPTVFMSCQPPSPPEGSSDFAEMELELDCGELIRRVIEGEDFSGRVVKLTGVALGKISQGLVNVGTAETYSSGYFLNFVSVYEVPGTVAEGIEVEYRVFVEKSSAQKLPDGQDAVQIDSAFRP